MPNSGRELPVAVALTLVSGAVMVWAGAVLATGSASTALWITLPPVVTIEAAFAVIRRSDRRAGRSTPWRLRLRQEAVVLVAGGVMMLAGYAGAAINWLLAAPVIVVGGFVVAPGLIANDPDRKRLLVRAAEKYLANPPTKLALLLGLPLPLVLLETTGRVTGKPRRTPVMKGLVGNHLWIVAEHGRHAGYVRNLIADPRIRVKAGRGWRDGTATVLPDDDPLARAAWIARQLGRPPGIDVMATRLFCVQPMTVCVTLAGSEPQPSAAPPASIGEDRR